MNFTLNATDLNDMKEQQKNGANYYEKTLEYS